MQIFMFFISSTISIFAGSGWKETRPNNASSKFEVQKKVLTVHFLVLQLEAQQDGDSCQVQNNVDLCLYVFVDEVYGTQNGTSLNI